MSSSRKKKLQKKIERNKISFNDWRTTLPYQQSKQKRKAKADEQRRKEREELYQELKQEREELEKPLKYFNNKEEAAENLKLALKGIFISSFDPFADPYWKKIIDKVSKRLVNITDTKLQERSAYQLSRLIVYWKDNLGYYDDRLETLENIAYEEENEEYINDQTIIAKIDKIPELPPPYLDDADGLNKSRKKRPKKKSLESRKKRRKEKKSLKLRRRLRKRNKKKTKKRE